MASTVRRLKEAGRRLNRTVHLTFVPDEEVGGKKGDDESQRRRRQNKLTHRRMARGGHGLPKVSLEPAMPDPSIDLRGPPLKREGRRPKAVFYHFGHLTPFRFTLILTFLPIQV
jgi:hypothetical protein